MKFSTLVLSGLVLVGSSAAFAEGGSERVQQFYENFRVSQQQVHGDKNQNTAKAESNKASSDAKQQQPDA